MKKITFVILFLSSFFSIASIAAPITQDEALTSQYFSSIKNNPLQLYMFLNEMPKGGDLHSHFAGAVYAENLIRYSKTENFCINLPDYSLSINPYCPQSQQLSQALNNPELYHAIIDHWSMLNFKPGMENQNSNQEHFFSVFSKFNPLIEKHAGQILSELVTRAAEQHEEYLELIMMPQYLGLVEGSEEPAAEVGKQVGWNDNLSQLRQKLLNQGLKKFVKKISPALDSIESQMHKQLHCGTTQAEPGCNITLRYQYAAMRNLPPEQFFAELVTAFEIAKTDPRVVGVNVIRAEDSFIAIRDYDLQMRMINFLHQLSPQVHITLHAGEMAPQNVSPEVLRNHIKNGVEIGSAERIGQAADIAYEDSAQQLLKEMAKKHILVETSLTSNAVLLGLEGKDHPILLYLQNHVPIALSTDDEGVLRTDLTREFQRAVLTYHFDYETLKMFARNSIAYSFLPGKNLWENRDKFIPVVVCENEKLGAEKPLRECQEFLNKNEKAKLQWQLENEFDNFEKKIAERKY